MALYEITYTPADKVEGAATARGWKDNGVSSWWDYVSDDEFCQAGGRFLDFAEAVRHAQVLAPLDVCGEARISRIVRVHWRGAPSTWEVEAFWNIDEDTSDASPDKPDHTNELELSDGDEVLA